MEAEWEADGVRDHSRSRLSSGSFVVVEEGREGEMWPLAKLVPGWAATRSSSSSLSRESQSVMQAKRSIAKQVGRIAS